MKYQGELRVATALGELMAWSAFWRGWAGRFDAVVPVPLHPSKLRERGFNQAEQLALAAGASLALPVVQPVVRTRNTPTQSGLSWAERRKNVERAFAVPDPARVRGRKLLIVDDVYTTGSTLSAVGAALKRAGASRCYGLCAAVAASDRDIAKESSGEALNQK